MTDKEQIIIDTNKYFVEVIDESKSTIGYYVVHPEGLLREITKQNKQLACKTLECKELKKYKDVVDRLSDKQIILTNKDKMPKLYKNIKDLKLECYRKTLEEIEKIVGECSAFDYNAKQILDVISKAKGEES